MKHSLYNINEIFSMPQIMNEIGKLPNPKRFIRNILKHTAFMWKNTQIQKKIIKLTLKRFYIYLKMSHNSQNSYG